MAKKRVYEVAKEMDVIPKELTEFIINNNIFEIKSHMSYIDDEAIERVKKEISRQELDMYVFVTTIRKNDGSTHVRNYGASKYPWYQIITPFLTTQSVVVRKMYFQQTGGWDESLHYWNDWELGVRLLTNKPQMLYFQDKSYHIIHSHPNSITGRSLSERFDEINIAKNNDKVHISINENSLDVIGNKYEILCKENKKYNESYRKLDNFLKNL